SLSGVGYRQGDLYAVFGRNGSRSVQKVRPVPFKNQFEFDRNVKLVYALDGGLAGPFSVPRGRDFAAVLAVRLVSHSEGNKESTPTVVYLRRDNVRSRGRMRPSMTGRVSAVRYYNYHHPDALRAADSYLEREFHTEYTYRDNEPERR